MTENNNNMEEEREEEHRDNPRGQEFVYLDNPRNALPRGQRIWAATMFNEKIRKAADNLARSLAVAGLEDEKYMKEVLRVAKSRIVSDYWNRKEGHKLEYVSGLLKKRRINGGESRITRGCISEENNSS